VIVVARSFPRARLCGCGMTSAEVRMTRMPILISNYAHPAMPLPKAAGMSAMRFCVAAEMPPIAPRLQSPPPVSSTCRTLPTNPLVQSASRWHRAAKRVLHPQDRDISSRQSSSPMRFHPRRQSLALMHPFCHRPPSIMIPHMAHGYHCHPTNAR
jgi:hypothetical protein